MADVSVACVGGVACDWVWDVWAWLMDRPQLVIGHGSCGRGL